MILSAGWAGQQAAAGAPRAPRGAGLPAPGEEEVERSYRELLYRQVCRGVADCRELWSRQPRFSGVGQVECRPMWQAGRVRCAFTAHETVIAAPVGPVRDVPTGSMVNAYLCTGVFQRSGRSWRMLSVVGECLPRVP